MFGPDFKYFPGQTKDALKKFMDSLIAKTGKLRQLIRELETKYDDAAATTFISRSCICF